MAYSWLKKRGRTWHLCYAKSTGMKARSLHTTDRGAALEIQRRAESEIWQATQGIKRKAFDRIKYSQLVEKYIEHKGATAISPASIENDLRVFNRLGEFLGRDKLIDQVTTEDLESFIQFRRTSRRHCDVVRDRPGKTLAAKTLRNECFTLVAMFNWACSRDLLAENPTKRMVKPKKVSYNDRERAMTPEQYAQLRTALKPEYVDTFDLYYLTGLRRGEGVQVTSENFNFEKMEATFFQGKTQRYRTLPLTADLAEVARRMITRAGVGRPLVEVKKLSLTKIFSKARQRAGLPERFTFHSLRHSFCTMVGQSNVGLPTLMSLTGHASVSAASVYLHSFDTTRKSAIENVKLPDKKAV
jgi:integrase